MLAVQHKDLYIQTTDPLSSAHVKVFARELALLPEFGPSFHTKRVQQPTLKAVPVVLDLHGHGIHNVEVQGIVVASVFYSDSKLEFSSILFTIFS